MRTRAAMATRIRVSTYPEITRRSEPFGPQSRVSVKSDNNLAAGHTA